MDLVDWDPDHPGTWAWFCLNCEADDRATTNTIRTILDKQMVPIRCPYCGTDTLILEKACLPGM